MLLIAHPGSRLRERSYIYDVVLRDFLGLQFRMKTEDRRDVVISIAEEIDGRQLVMPDALLGIPEAAWLKKESLPRRPVSVMPPAHSIVGGRGGLPVLYGAPRGGVWRKQEKGRTYLGVDVFGSSFFLLTRYEEIAVGDRDPYDRFPAKASVLVQEGLLNRALVNEYTDLLWLALSTLWPVLRRKGRSYSVQLSHDLDEPSLIGRRPRLVARTIGADLVRRRDVALATRKLTAYMAGSVRRRPSTSDPYNTFGFIMSTSESYGLMSCFNVFGGRSHKYDARHTVDDHWIIELLARIKGRGHEIGLHPSYQTYRDAERLKMEYGSLVRACATAGIEQSQWGARQHFLRWENPVTWQIYEEAGLDYDSSLTFAEHAGFRTGCCYDYPVMNLRSREVLHLRERPLIAMESSLLNYMKLSYEEGEEQIAALAKTCRAHQGTFTLLWHNATLVTRESQAAYRRIIGRLFEG